MSGELGAIGDGVADGAHGSARVCASCGASLTPGLRFCASCGNWIGTDEPVVAAEPVLVEDQPAAVLEEEPVLEQPAMEQPVRELPALAVHEPLSGELAMSEVHSMPASTRVEERPVTFARESLSWVRRVLLAIILLLVFAAAAAALRLTR